MKIRHLSRPFYHTIIDNFYEEEELKKVTLEIEKLNHFDLQCLSPTSDRHHTMLFSDFHTESFCLDQIYGKEDYKSVIMNVSKKLYNLELEKDSHKNPFLGYIPHIDKDTFFIQKYSNGSFYPIHQDESVFTFLCVIEVQSHKGGELFFSKHRYTPRLKNNMGLIFPGYELHEVKQIKCKHSGYLRYSINQRVGLKPIMEYGK